MYLKHLIIVSLCLLTVITNARAGPTDKTDSKLPENKDTPKGVQKQEPEPEKKQEEQEPEPERVQITKKGDNYVVVRLLVEPKLGDNKFKSFSLIYALEKTNEKGEKEWTYSNKDASIAGIAYKSVDRKKAGSLYQYDMEINNIKSASKIKLAFTAIYGTEKVAMKEIETQTKPKAPVIKILPTLLTLQFENPNAVRYFAKVNKIKDGKESDCVLDVQMSPCFGNSLGLPGLMSGEKYSISVWYIQADKTESEETRQEITA